MKSHLSLPSLELTLYAALLALAFAMRFYRLGDQPLSDEEARAALAVLARLRGDVTAVALPVSPAYFFATFFSFFLFGASEATARLGPALAGTALVVVPTFFRGLLGRGGALVSAALLAISSTLLAASRSADGTVLGLLGLALGAGSLWHYAQHGRRRWLFLGAAALAVGLASGGAFLMGALAGLLTLLILSATQPESIAALRSALSPLGATRATLLTALGIVMLLIVTVLSLYPSGLGALVASWGAWLGGFMPGAAGRPAQLLPTFLLAYEPLLLAMGVAGILLAVRRGESALLGVAWFCLLALALVVFHSGRQMADLVWLAAGLSVLAGWAIAKLVAGTWHPQDWPLVATQVAIGFSLAVFALLTVARYVEETRGGQAVPMLQTVIFGRAMEVPAEAQLAVAGLAIALVLLVAYLFAMGWSGRASRLGLLLTVLAVLLPATLSAGWGVTQARAGDPGELWWAKPASSDIGRLMETLGAVSNYSVGNTHDIELTVQASDTSMLRWLLRDFPNAVFVDRLGPQMISPVVITPINEDNPTLGSSYVGQDFDLRAAWVPPGTFAQWVAWAAYRRTGAVQAEPVILWVRQDVQQLTSTGN